MSVESAVTQVIEAIGSLRGAGGLVVVEGGPGSGKSQVLRCAGGTFQRSGTPVVVSDDAQADASYPAEATVLTTRTAGLTWAPGIAAHAARLVDQSRLHVVRLSPLTARAVSELIRSAGADRVDAAARTEAEIQGLAAATGGNPLVAVHLARSSIDREPTIDAVVAGRLLDRFGPAARAVATVAAALTTIRLEDMDMVADLADLTPPAAAEAFDLLVAAGSMAEGTQPGTYVLAIPWLADAVYATLGPATRDRIHRSAAITLFERPVVRHDLVAHHLLRTAATDHQTMSCLLTVADALTATAPHLSVECYRRILAAGAEPPEHVADLTARLARATLLAGRPEDTISIGRALLAGPASLPSPEYAWLLPIVTEAMKATSAVDDAEDMLRSTQVEGIDQLVDIQSAYLYAASGRDTDAQVRIRRARTSLSERSIRGRINVLSTILHTLCISANFTELRRDAETLVDLLEEAPEDSRLHGWATLAHVLSVAGDLVGSARAADEAERLLTGEAWGLYVPEIRYARAMIASADGRWDEALRIATDADEPLTQSGTLSYLQPMRHVRSRILANRGEFTDARRVDTPPVPGPAYISALRTATLAEIEMLEGSADACIERLAAALEEDRLPGGVRATILALLAAAAATSGDHGVVRDCVDEVETRWGTATVSRQVRLELQLAQAQAEGSADLATQVLGEAAEHRFALFEGRALLTLGYLDVDPETNLTQAIRQFGALTAVPWRRAAATALRDRGMRVPRRPRTSADSLTETEVQLARLVQAARSNKEIADVMSLSVKTVEVYLSRLYAKVGCRNRLDLARAADEGRLPLA